MADAEDFFLRLNPPKEQTKSNPEDLFIDIEPPKIQENRAEDFLVEQKPENKPTWKDAALGMVKTSAMAAIPGSVLATEEGQRLLRVPSEKSAEGLKMLTDMIPDPETKSTFANFVLGTPKAAAEVFSEMSAGMLTPEAATLGGYGKGARTLAKSEIGKKAGEKILSKIPETLKRWTTYRYNQPELYKEIAEVRQFNIAENAKKLLDVAKPLVKRPAAVQRAAGSYMKGELPASSLPKEVVEEANAARDAFTKLGNEAVELGLLPEKVFKKNVATYFPRMFRRYEEAKNIKAVGRPKPNRIDIQRFKKRQDIPQEVREGMGEILEAGYPTAKGLTQLSKAVETAKMFRQVARNPEWAVAKAEDGMARGFKQLPTSKTLGELSGRWVHPEIADDLQQIVREVPKWEKVWGDFLGKWKYAKVIANPSTHFRNMLSNSILLDLGGVDHMQQLKLLPKAAKELTKKGRYFTEAKQARLLGEEFVGGELKAIKDAAGLNKGSIIELLGKYSENLAQIAQRGKMAIKKGTSALADLYQGEEQLFKLAKFIHNREQGMTVKAAAADAEKWLFNYGKVSPLVEKLRRSPAGSPFITFTAKAMPRVAETVATNPVKLYKYKLLFDAIENKAKEVHGLADEDIEVMHEQAKGNQIVLPLSDSEGRPMTLDLSYIMPWGDVGEQGGFFGLPPIAPPSGPAKTLLEVGMNKNMFMDKPIYQETDLPHQKIAKVMDHIMTSITPSLTPGLDREDSPFKGGYSWRKFVDAAKNKKDYFGKNKIDMGTAVSSAIFGLKLSPADPNEMRTYQAYDKIGKTEEIRKDFVKKARNPNLSEEDRAKLPALYYEKLKRIWEPNK